MGVQAYLRMPTVLLSRSRRHFIDRIDVFEPLVLADDLLRRRLAMSGSGAGDLAETS